MRPEPLDVGRAWTRIADPSWTDPLDPGYASHGFGGRWTRPGGPDTLYLNEDVDTARANIRRFFAGSPVTPEDLDDDRSYVLLDVVLTGEQTVVDAHTDAGLTELGLPVSYPLDQDGKEVGHDRCQPIGQEVYDAGFDGIHCRSAAGAADSGRRELAWFPRGRRAVLRATRRFGDWYYPTPP
jgi:hypothetical protein